MERNYIIVGIDLGTTFITCCFYNPQTDKYETLRFLSGQNALAACVDFDKRPVVVGVPLPNAIGEVKRLIGLKFNDSCIQEDIEKCYFPYDIQEDEEGYCQIVIRPTYQVEVLKLKPEEVLAIQLRVVKRELQKVLRIGDDVKIKTVGTVPAFFTDEHKDRTKLAFELAGFDVVALFNEPSAAALAYNEMEERKPGYLLAFGLGGSCFDLAIMQSSGDNKRMVFKKTSGDHHLGGMDFDKNFAEKIFQIWEDEHPENNLVHLFRMKGRDTIAVKVAKQQRMFKMRKIAEKAKIELSHAEEVDIDLSEFYDGDEFMLPVTRKDFEECNQQLFDRCMEMMQNALKGANVRPNMITEVILYGGSSQIPKIQQMVKEQFPSAKIDNTLDCRVVVAKGACMYCKQKVDGGMETVSETLANDIYLVGSEGPVMLIEKGTPLPHTHDFYVETHDVEAYTELMEGDRSLGKFTLKPIPRGEQVVQFIVEINEEGVLTVSGKLSDGTVLKAGCTVLKKSSRNERIRSGIEKIDGFFQ